MNQTKSERPARAPSDRAIRVFVSSTFRDMQEERDYLVKHVFPRLRRLCEERFVTWSEVDLRWGVTEEAAAEGKVLPICLAEIHNCRPYFIGLLGERYGWVPEEISEELIEQEPWLAEHRERSVTELEILHGVLNNPAMAGHAYFYFRAPAYVEHLPEGLRAEHAEAASESEVRRFGAEEAERRLKDRREKLRALKERIRRESAARNMPLHEDYPNPEALGELIFQDFQRLIDDLFPEKEVPDALEREAADHEAFARSRAGVYIGRSEYFDFLDAHAGAAEGPPLVVLGESGGGKSALLSNWAFRWRSTHPRDLVLMHFIGSSPASADWAAMLRRILGEFNRRLDLGVEIPDEPEDLRAAFTNALHMASAQCHGKGFERVVLILDGLNQLEDRDQAPDLAWLPPVIPENVRMLLSTLPGRPLEELTRRQWPTMRVEPLRDTERKRFIRDYLRQYTKELSAARVEHIAADAEAENPLYLRALLEELRVFGVHEALDERINWYLETDSVPELYARILQRWEEDYNPPERNLVREAMEKLWAARRGLSEAELLELLGKDGEPLPAAQWAPLYLAARESLVERSGLIGFFHDYLREAVHMRYLAEGKAQATAHRRLAAYFAKQEIAPRRIDEEPWQWMQAQEWDALYNLLADLPFFAAAWHFDKQEVLLYWAAVESNSHRSKADAYRTVIESPGDHQAHVWKVASLLNATGLPQEGEKLRAYQVGAYREEGNKRRLQAALGNQGLTLYWRGDFDGAMNLFREQEALCRELGIQDSLQMSLGRQANVLIDRGDFAHAMKLTKEQERICRELGLKARMPACLCNQAQVLYKRGKLDDALRLFREQERCCRELGDKTDLAGSLNNQAVVLSDRGDLGGAMSLLEEAEGFLIELGLRRSLQSTLSTKATVLKDAGDLDGAMASYKEGERICRELGLQADLAGSLNDQALILKERGDLDGAMALHKEGEHICRELGLQAALSKSLGNQALILREWGESDSAMALHKQEERICRVLSLKADLATSLGNQALLLYDRGNRHRAVRLWRKQERICRELGLNRGISFALGNQGVVLRELGDLDKAIELHREEERICRELSLKGELQGCLFNQALIRYDRDDLDGAMALYKEQESICRELHHKSGLQPCLQNQALICYEKGDLDKAMALYKEEEGLCRMLGLQDALKTCLENQASTLEAISAGHIAEDEDNAAGHCATPLNMHTQRGGHAGKSLSQFGRYCKSLFRAFGTRPAATGTHTQARGLESLITKARDSGDLATLCQLLGKLSLLLLNDRVDLKRAEDLMCEQERVAAEIGDERARLIAINNRGEVLRAWGRYEEALRLHADLEKQAREADEPYALLYTLANRAEILLDHFGRYEEALMLAEEADRIYRECRFTDCEGWTEGLLEKARAGLKKSE